MLQSTTDGILVSTQSSIDIDFIPNCIIPELAWNREAMSQYYGRFARLTSDYTLKVYFVTNLRSIEINLLNMIFAKERLNLYMKGVEIDNEALYEKYNVDPYFLRELMIKGETENGYIVDWGKQEIS